MNNYLEIKKQSVNYWSKISALTLTLLPGMIRGLRGDKAPWLGSWKDKVLVISGLLCFLALNYYGAYSVFCPARLSLLNWLLLVPCGVVILLGVRRMGRLLEKKEI